MQLHNLFPFPEERKTRRRVGRGGGSGLGGTAGSAVRRRSVQPILEHIKVEVTHIHHAEVVQRVGGGVVLVHLVPAASGSQHLIQLHQRVFIQLFQLIVGHHILVRVKVIQVAQAITSGVADLSVIIRQLLQDLLTDAHIGVVIGRSHPQTQNIRAVLVDNVRRVNTVAQGLTHLLALTVYSPAVGDDLLKGRRLPGGYAGE